MLTNEELNNLVLEVFKKTLSSDIINIKNSNIYFNVNGEEIVLNAFKRCNKEKFKDNNPYTIDELHKSYFPGFGWTVLTPDSELLDFYLTIRDKQYRVPRPSLKVYAEWIELLSNQLDNYEQNLFKLLLK